MGVLRREYGHLSSTGLVLLQGDIAMFRAKQMIQDKAQTADNGRSLLRAVTPYWVIC